MIAAPAAAALTTPPWIVPSRMNRSSWSVVSAIEFPAFCNWHDPWTTICPPEVATNCVAFPVVKVPSRFTVPPEASMTPSLVVLGELRSRVPPAAASAVP